MGGGDGSYAAQEQQDFLQGLYKSADKKMLSNKKLKCKFTSLQWKQHVPATKDWQCVEAREKPSATRCIPSLSFPCIPARTYAHTYALH